MNEKVCSREITRRDYWKYLWRRKIMIISMSAVCVALALGISLMLPKYYKSEAMILAVAPETGGLSAALSSSPLAGALTGSIGGLTTPADKVLVLLKSRTVADMVIRKFDLLRVFNEDKWDAAKGTWKSDIETPLMEDTVKKLSKKVTSFKKSREGTITITVEWKDPKLAAGIANYYITALAEFMKNKSVNTTVQIIDPAIPAEKKSWPKTVPNMLVAGILSLGIGFIAAIYLESESRFKHEP